MSPLNLGILKLSASPATAAPRGARWVKTTSAPPPAGTYSQGVAAGGFVFLAGQTPRTPEGRRLTAAPFADQVRQTFDNLAAVAAAAGASLADAIKVTIYLRDPHRAAEFDAIYQTYLSDPLGEKVPARTLVQSDLPHGDIEADAVLWITRT